MDIRTKINGIRYELSILLGDEINVDEVLEAYAKSHPFSIEDITAEEVYKWYSRTQGSKSLYG